MFRMVYAAIVINLIWAYWIHFYSKRFKNKYLLGFFLAMGTANFTAALALLFGLFKG